MKGKCVKSKQISSSRAATAVSRSVFKEFWSKTQIALLTLPAVIFLCLGNLSPRVTQLLFHSDLPLTSFDPNSFSTSFDSNPLTASFDPNPLLASFNPNLFSASFDPNPMSTSFDLNPLST